MKPEAGRGDAMRKREPDWIFQDSETSVLVWLEMFPISWSAEVYDTTGRDLETFTVHEGGLPEMVDHLTTRYPDVRIQSERGGK